MWSYIFSIYWLYFPYQAEHLRICFGHKQWQTCTCSCSGKYLQSKYVLTHLWMSCKYLRMCERIQQIKANVSFKSGCIKGYLKKFRALFTLVSIKTIGAYRIQPKNNNKNRSNLKGIAKHSMIKSNTWVHHFEQYCQFKFVCKKCSLCMSVTGNAEEISAFHPNLNNNNKMNCNDNWFIISIFFLFHCTECYIFEMILG